MYIYTYIHIYFFKFLLISNTIYFLLFFLKPQKRIKGYIDFFLWYITISKLCLFLFFYPRKTKLVFLILILSTNVLQRSLTGG